MSSWYKTPLSDINVVDFLETRFSKHFDGSEEGGGRGCPWSTIIRFFSVQLVETHCCFYLTRAIAVLFFPLLVMLVNCLLLLSDLFTLTFRQFFIFGPNIKVETLQFSKIMQWDINVLLVFWPLWIFSSWKELGQSLGSNVSFSGGTLHLSTHVGLLISRAICK